MDRRRLQRRRRLGTAVTATAEILDLDYLGLPAAIGCWLLRDDHHAAMIECGPASTFGSLVAALAERGLAPRDITDVVVTHIHLDHAGAAGHMAEHGATIHVHEFGAPHLVDPTRLTASATRIYGDDMDRLWGQLRPVPHDQVRAVRDGDRLEVGGTELVAMETPGHARHHHAFAVELADGRACFAGDAAAMILPVEGDPISLPMPPPEFDLDLWRATIDRIDGADFDRLLLTHFGAIADPAAHLEALRGELTEQVAWIRASDDLDAYRAWMGERMAAQGVSGDEFTRYMGSHLLSMNLSGVRRWLAEGQAGG